MLADIIKLAHATESISTGNLNLMIPGCISRVTTDLPCRKPSRGAFSLDPRCRESPSKDQRAVGLQWERPNVVTKQNCGFPGMSGAKAPIPQVKKLPSSKTRRGPHFG
jgi:hypothetical protein